MMKKALELNQDFKEYHLWHILNLIELDYDIKNEQATLDDHGEKIVFILDHLQLLLVLEKVAPRIKEGLRIQ